MKNVLNQAGLAVLFFAGATMAQAPGFQPVGTVHQLMVGLVAPASDVIFAVPNHAPQSDKEWVPVQNAALTLAEVGNLLMIPGRAKDNGDWMKYAKRADRRRFVGVQSGECERRQGSGRYR